MESEKRRKNAIYHKVLTTNNEFNILNVDKNHFSGKPLNKKPILKNKTSEFTKEFIS